MYNTNSDGVVNYSSQDGSIGNVIDAGKGENVEITSISDDIITTSSATLENLQSIFKFTFKCGDNEISGIRFVRIFSENNKLISQYNVLTSTPTFGPVTISRSDNLPNNYIYAALRFDSNPGDIVFQVVDETGKVYSGSKTAPAGGFLNGKFYAPTVNVNLYTFTLALGKTVCFSPGDLGVDNGVYSFTEPFTTWAHLNTSAANSAADAPAQRVWFDFYYDGGLSTGTVYGITNWRIPIKEGSTYEWDYLITSRTMQSGVNTYYRVTIPGHQYCLLLPPDETELTTAEKSELESGSIGDNGYVKYLGKGFVLLFNTNRGMISGTKWSWGKNTSGYARHGFYWSTYYSGSRIHFTWGDSDTPAVNYSTSNRMRNHIRYVHDVTVSIL